jgi:hypothetical protein
MTRHQGGNGDPSAVIDLVELLRTLCRVPGAAAAVLLGTSRPSELSEQFVRIEPTRFHAFRAIELRPWSDDEFGIALPELADQATWSVSDLVDVIGPLREGPRMAGQGPQLQGFLDDPVLPARAAVYFILAGDDPQDTVEEIRIRIESMDRK